MPHDDRDKLTGRPCLCAAHRVQPLGGLAREALRLSEKVGRQELIASVSHRLAKALMRQGKKEEALPHVRRAVKIYQKLGSPYFASIQEILAECES